MALAMGMKLDKDFLLDYHLENNNQLRLLHYPEAPRGDFDSGKKGRINAHTDFGTYVHLANTDKDCTNDLSDAPCCSKMKSEVLRLSLPLAQASSFLRLRSKGLSSSTLVISV